VDNSVDKLWITLWIWLWIKVRKSGLWTTPGVIHTLSTGRDELSTALIHRQLSITIYF